MYGIAGLIVSVISIFIVVSVGATIYASNKRQSQTYDQKLQDVTTKTNNANQYEYEKNKDQEVSLDKVKNDMLGYDSRMAKIQTDFDFIKKQQGSQIVDLQNNLQGLQTSLKESTSGINDVNRTQDDRIGGLNNRMQTVEKKVDSANDQIGVINGQLVNIGTKQQTQIDSITNDNQKIKKEQGDIRDVVYGIKSENISRLQDQNTNISNFQSSTNTKLNTQNQNIKTITDKATSLETLISGLNTALNDLKTSLNNYMTKTGMSSYASKGDVNNVDGKFSNYLSLTDFNSFKANMPSFPTKAEMDGYVATLVTKPDLQTVNQTVSTLQTTLTQLSGVLDTVKNTYATKNDLLQVTGNSAQGTVNMSSLYVTLQAVQDSLKTMQNNITAANNNLTNYQTTATNTFASKNELNTLNTSLTSQISNLKSATSSIMDTLTVNKSLTARGDVVLNNIRFSTNWTGFPDNATDKSEIANDINGAKKLMIVGNKSAGAERRVGIWDRLDVHGTLGVDATATAKNVQGNDNVLAGNWGSWMRSDGAMHAGNRHGVGISPDHAWFGNGRQFIVEGGGNNEWQTTMHNKNGDRWVHMNHGDGHGIHINTNDQRADRYGLQVHNGKRELLTVFNTGEKRWNNANGTWTHFDHPNGRNYIRNDTVIDGKINPDGWTDFNYVKVGQGPAWNPGEDVNATGTYLHKDGQIRGRNTTENDWVHKLYGREHINMHMLHNQGFGLHINTRNNEAGKYAIQTFNRDGETFRVTNEGRTYVPNKLGVGIDPNHEWFNNKQGIMYGHFPDWQFGLHNTSGGRWFWANHGDGYGMHINTNDQRGDRYAIQAYNGNREVFTVFNGGEKRWLNRNGNWTHFDHPDENGKNYIRGPTQFDVGYVRMTVPTYLNDNPLYIRGDNNHSIQWSGDVDGPRIGGYNGGKLSSRSRDSLFWSDNGVVWVPTELQSRQGYFGPDDQRKRYGWPGGWGGGLMTWDLQVNASFNNRSDATEKKDITPLASEEVKKVNELKPVSFKYKDDKNQKQHYGFVAQDVEKQYPTLVSTTDKGKKYLNYLEMIPLLTGNLKHLNKKVNDEKLCIGDTCLTKDDIKALKYLARSG